MSYLKRIAVMSLASLGLATAGLVIGAYSGGASGVTDGSPAVTASAPALNCTLPPPGVPAADWCPPATDEAAPGARRVRALHTGGMRLRDATAADLPVIADLIRALAAYERLTHEIEWTEPELAATLFGPGAVPRVVLAEPTDPPGHAVGLAVWFPTYSTFLGRPGIWLEDLFVRPEARGAGIGTALLQHLFDRVGGGRVEWAVLDWNEPSIDFYRRQGARPVPGWTRYRWRKGS